MLLSAVLALRPTQPGSQRAFLGKAAHAFFLRLVSEADAELATALHDQSENRPFTVSTPMTLRMGRATGAPVAGYDQVLRITSYAPDLSRLLVQRALPRLPQRIALGDDVFSVRGVFVDRDFHPLGDQTSYEQLADRYLLSSQRPPARVKLHFASPTTFRSGDKNVPLPLPGLVFGGLADRWNAHSPITVPADTRSYAEEHMAIAQCAIRTRTIDIAGGKQVGFVGSCSYLALVNDAYWQRIIGLLAAFAFYSGVGYKTTMGFGQTFTRPVVASARASASDYRRQGAGDK